MTDTPESELLKEDKRIHRTSFLLSCSSHWHKWAWNAKLELIDLSLWDTKRDLPINSSKTMVFLIRSITESTMTIIQREECAQSAWIKLKDHYAGQSLSNQLTCFAKLVSHKNSTMSSFVQFYKDLSLELISALGDKDNINIHHLISLFCLNGLPSNYDGERAVLSSKACLPTLDELEKIVQEKESRRPLLQAKQARGEEGNTCKHGFPSSSCWTCHPELKPTCILT